MLRTSFYSYDEINTIILEHKKPFGNSNIISDVLEGFEIPTIDVNGDEIDLDFSKYLMVGTGWNSINSMTDAIYYYKKGRLTINATYFWTWFLDGVQRNDISVNNKEDLIKLLNKYEKT